MKHIIVVGVRRQGSSHSEKAPVKVDFAEYDVLGNKVQVDYTRKLVSINGGEEATFTDFQEIVSFLDDLIL